MSKYIKVDDLQRYCDNQKDHSITPNEFQRMTQHDFGWNTGTPTEEGWYLLAVKHGEKIHYNANRLYSGGEWFYSKLGEVLAWQKIEPYRDKYLERGERNDNTRKD